MQTPSEKYKRFVNSLFLYSALFVIIIIFTACFSDWKGESIITINLSGNSRSVTPWPPQDHGILDELEYIVLFSGDEEFIIEAKGGTNIRASVSSGRWNIEIKAFYQNELYAKGKIDDVDIRRAIQIGSNGSKSKSI